MILTLIIFVLTLILIMFRPKPLNEATAALLGAILMLATTIISPSDAYDVLKTTANILLFFLGLMIVCAVADRAGFFEWSAFKAVKLANGRGRRLLLVLFCLGTVITTFFSNDATALILTPIVYVVVTKLKLNPLPYVFACAFIANTASMMLPISNPVNLLPVDQFELTLSEYLRFLLLPTILAILINVALFAVLFRKAISTSFKYDGAVFSVKIDGFFLFTCVGLVLTALGYIFASLYGLPLSWPALGGAAVLLTGGFAFGRLTLKRVNSGISWSILLFIFCLALLVKGLDNAGVTHTIGEALTDLSSKGSLGAILATSFGTAVGSNLINNWSMMMVSVSSLGNISTSITSVNQGLIYSSIVGADLGPNIAIIGSLSSMLWLVILRQRGLDIHPMQYLRLGLIVAPPMLLAAALGLYACSRF
jgi:arsenical pump membrane protein